VLYLSSNLVASGDCAASPLSALLPAVDVDGTAFSAADALDELALCPDALCADALDDDALCAVTPCDSFCPAGETLEH